MSESWRIVAAKPFEGPENMAIDETLLTLVGDGVIPPTLRFYTWHSPWISLGSAQCAADIDVHEARKRGWHILRRPSGGTAVLHQGQLGYGLVLPTTHPLWRGDLAASYDRLSQPLAVAFANLGAHVCLAHPSTSASFTASSPPLAKRACFAALGPYEPIAQQRKIVGNSQVRRKASGLLHGVIQLRGDQRELAHVFAGVDPDELNAAADYLGTHVGSLEPLAGRPLSSGEVAAAIAEAYAEVLNVRFDETELSDQEQGLAADLVKTKYGNDEWTYRR